MKKPQLLRKERLGLFRVSPKVFWVTCVMLIKKLLFTFFEKKGKAKKL